MTELNLCTLGEMLQRSSADWADAGKKLTKRAPIIAETMKFISMKLKENEQDMANHTIDTARPKNKLTNERDNFKTKKQTYRKMKHLPGSG